VSAYLHERFPGLKETLPHLPLGDGPTPVRRLPRLAGGPAPVWLKDDGAYGTGGWGGNKVRKLEWLLPEIKSRGRDTILTVGALGTNWGLATALYGREHGLRTVLALVDQPVDDHVREQLERLKSSGAKLYFTRTKARTIAAMPWLVVRHTSRGRPPYLLGAGGSSPVGVLGYVEAALEIGAQVRAGLLPEPSHLVTAVGSGGTAAGLLLGLRMAGLRTRVVGVVVNDTLRLDRRSLADLARRTARLLLERGAGEVRALDETAIHLVRDWMGEGYGHPTPAGERALKRAAEREDLLLEPVYTAKAAAALRAMNEQGRFGDGPVLFLRTNGPR
jgi:D-cysteine desulfhydrase